MILSINIDSISSMVGAVITLTFAIYYFTSYIIVKKERIYWILSIFMLSVFIYLIGYSLYSSANDTGIVLFWTRICYSGGAVIIYTSYLLTSEIINIESKKLKGFLLFLTLILLVIIFLPSDKFFTHELNPLKTHSSVIKGPLFPFILLLIYLSDFYLILRFFLGVINNKEQLYLIGPILFGLVFWFCEAIFDGLFGAILSLVNMKFSLGPIIMTFSLSLFSGRYAERKNTELIRIKKENEDIYNNLIYDNLSSLFSRQYFIEALEQRAALVRREGTNDCLMFLDVDNFKTVNDELGHSSGDDLIRNIGRILNSDSRKSDICARYGGDEFLILLENCQISDAQRIAENLQKKLTYSLKNLFGDWPGIRKITFSIGLIPSSLWSNSPAEIIERADIAMYEAKKRGKNRSFLYSESMIKSNSPS